MSQIYRLLVLGILSLAPLAAAQWEVQQSNLPGGMIIYGISAINQDVAWAFGANTKDGGFSECTWFCRTLDGGQHWLAGTIPLPKNFFISNISAVNADTAWAAVGIWSMSDQAGVYKTTDGGKNWVQQKSAFNYTNYGANFVHFFNALDGIVVGDPIDGFHSIYTTNDGGSNWQRFPNSDQIAAQPGEYASIFMYCVTGRTFFFGCCYGSSGRLFRSTDLGKSWQVFRTRFTTPATLHVWPAFKDSLNGIVGAAGTSTDIDSVGITTDGGLTWKSTDSPQVSSIWCAYMTGTPAGYMLAGGGSWGARQGRYPGTAFTLDQGATWTKIDDIPRTTPCFVSPDIGWAGAQNSNLIYKWHIGQQAAIGCYPVSTITFAQTHTGWRSDSQILSITNYGKDPLVVTDIIPPGPNFRLGKVFALPGTLNSLETAQVELFFTPAAGGTLTDKLIIKSNASRTPEYSINLQGEGAAIAQVQPGVFYAVTAKTLYTMDPGSGAATQLAPMTIQRAMGLAVNPSSQELIGIITATANTEIHSICAATGKTVLLRTLPIGATRAFAFKGDTLYAASTTGQLYRIMLATGESALIGTAPGIKYYGLAVHPATGQLYASASSASGTSKDLIVTIDPASGDTTLVGTTGDNTLTPALAFSPEGVLYGIKGSSTITIITIDLKTGKGTSVGTAGVSSLQGLAWAPNTTSAQESLETGAVPGEFLLLQNYPNPFNSETVIEYQLMRPGPVRVLVCNLLGETVAILVDRQSQAGRHRTAWTGRDGSGRTVPSGIYYVIMEAGGRQWDRKKMLLIR